MAEQLVYVNTASPSGGNGTTNGTSGANRAYSSFNEFNTQEAADISTATGSDTQMVVNFDGSGGADTTGNVLMSGFTTDSTGFVTFNFNRSGHTYRTVNDGNGYRHEFTTPSSYDYNIRCDDDYTVFNDFQGEQTSNDAACQCLEILSTMSSALS